jgi:riboflavin kinase/FMN adenylyltransferase
LHPLRRFAIIASPCRHPTVQRKEAPMLIQHGHDHVPANLRGAVLAIGNFDGVHRGHQALLTSAVETAKATGHKSGVIVFEPHPREYFQPKAPHFRLTPLNEKIRLFRKLGLDIAVVLPFNVHLANLTADAFVERILVAGLGVRHVVIGYDFFFGKDRAGTPDTMRKSGETMGFGVTVIAPVAEAGEAFSSSAIRLMLAQGGVRAAADNMGHWWRVIGKVVGGAKRGTGLGYPTANVAMPPGTTLGHGIYAVRVHTPDGAHHHGAAYLGTRPTFDDGKPVLEVFLFDFDNDLYGREIAVEFIDFVRADRKFDSIEALVEQIGKDCDEARRILVKADASDPMRTYPLGT